MLVFNSALFAKTKTPLIKTKALMGLVIKLRKYSNGCRSLAKVES